MKRQIFFLVSMIVIIILAIYKTADIVKINGTSTIKMIDKKEGKDLTISITKGEQYLHKFKINSFISIKTSPQFAVWIEDLNGNYIETLYATSKIVNQSWSKAPNDSAPKNQIKREEALPYWTHKRGNNVIEADVISSATPKGNFIIKTKTSDKQSKYLILAEFNSSTDFNEYYPKDAVPNMDNYSGGEWGSGQPALVYSTTIDLNSTNSVYNLKLIGHSSPSGKDGNLYEDFSKLTTAKNIIKSITIEVK
ncbi:DUF2271 domain-containing protein [Clostridiaceae bacterium UIB06]|uniref:DUF2271 domain-containing protein n=1 Tax=Clostridium thailandense TaxID=2794346 RepID=A0A949TY67_9CLOT|nr:DUF2271 domain-containing protein [Clostridium thailandense]MBV7274763.1 DUF2271 domain-containing protein [Clostridium thailandense]MCH5137224.1 DUF2271 domain-containing protein [Clostridiaceae bacterium UIB06]